MGRFSMVEMSGLVLALGLFVMGLPAAQSQPTVTVQQGALFGTTETFRESEYIRMNKTVDVFRGIPFAEPPIGGLRFRRPVAKQPWEGTYDATRTRDLCLQDPGQTFGFPMSEDCLYLNIFAPSPKPLGAAVMVWIHGGGFTVGSGSFPDFDGHPLVAVGDVIVITINYRLNVFGFLTTGDEASRGNMGLQDQVMALKWIKENIAAFGGNSDRITIFGESAGGASVNWLMLIEEAHGLFNQAIMQSGTAIAPWASFDNVELLRKQAFQMGERVGCSVESTYQLVDCLRNSDASTLLQTYLATPRNQFRAVPVVDGEFIVDTPANLYMTGRFGRAKLLLGTNADEGTFFVLLNRWAADYISSEEPPPVSREIFDEVLLEDLQYDFQSTGGSNDSFAALAAAIKMRYIDWSRADSPDADYFRAYVDYATDVDFACGTNFVARAHAQMGDDVYMYQMTHVPSESYISLFGVRPRWLGATHTEDLPFVFGVHFMPHYDPVTRGEHLPGEKELSVKFMEFWTNFARTGNPSMKYRDSQPESAQDYWPKFTVPGLEYKVLSVNLTTDRALKAGVCQFWNHYVLQLNTMFGPLDSVEREWRQSYLTWKYAEMPDWRQKFAEFRAATRN